MTKPVGAADVWVTTPAQQHNPRRDQLCAREILGVMRHLDEREIEGIFLDMRLDLIWQLALLAGGECAHSVDWQIKMIRRTAWRIYDRRRAGARVAFNGR